MESQIKLLGFWGVRKLWLVGFKNGKNSRLKKVVKERTVALLISYLLVAFHSVLKLQLKDHVTFMHKQKDTNLG